MKMRLIDVNDLLRDTCNECRAYYSEAKQSCPCNHGECDAIFTAKEIQSQPTIEAEPLRRGYWASGEVITFGGRKTSPLFCSKCLKVACGEPWTYCPNCGAKMEEVLKDE